MGLISFLKEKFRKKDASNEKYDKALEKSRKSFSNKLGNLSKKYRKVNQEYFEEVEEILIEADVGINLTLSTIERVLDRSKKERISETEEINENFRYVSGKTEVLKSLMNGIKVIGYEDLGKTLTVCVSQKLSKDDIRKYQKYMIKITDVPIHNIYVYLVNLREIRIKF